MRGIVTASVALMSILGLLCIGSGAYLWHLFGLVQYGPDVESYYEDSIPEEEDSGYEEIEDYDKIEQGAASVAEISVKGNTKNISNYLLIGVDSRSSSFRGLSDTIIILTIDKRIRTSGLRPCCATPSLPFREGIKTGTARTTTPS